MAVVALVAEEKAETTMKMRMMNESLTVSSFLMIFGT